MYQSLVKVLVFLFVIFIVLIPSYFIFPYVNSENPFTFLYLIVGLGSVMGIFVLCINVLVEVISSLNMIALEQDIQRLMNKLNSNKNTKEILKTINTNNFKKDVYYGDKLTVKFTPVKGYCEGPMGQGSYEVVDFNLEVFSGNDNLTKGLTPKEYNLIKNLILWRREKNRLINLHKERKDYENKKKLGRSSARNKLSNI